ncbi:MAG: DUF4864 domain-containing protein [Pseudomonadota bacterium]
MPDRLVAVLALVVALAVPAGAQDPPRIGVADRAAIRGIIESQIAAFRRDDGPAAFAHASPTIQGIFRTPEIFMDMVRGGYQPVYRPRAVDFAELEPVGEALIQFVDLIGPDGEPALAAYEMQRQEDGSWRINGCVLLPGRRRQV